MAAALTGDVGTDPSSACPEPEGIELVRVDERNRRLFVIATEEAVEQQKQVRRLLGRLAEHIDNCHSSWADSWSISVMSDVKFAGYKDEPEILPYVKNGSWAHGYLAEYDHRRKILVRFPLVPKRRIELKIHLGKQRETDP